MLPAGTCADGVWKRGHQAGVLSFYRGVVAHAVDVIDLVAHQLAIWLLQKLNYVGERLQALFLTVPRENTVIEKGYPTLQSTDNRFDDIPRDDILLLLEKQRLVESGYLERPHDVYRLLRTHTVKQLERDMLKALLIHQDELGSVGLHDRLKVADDVESVVLRRRTTHPWAILQPLDSRYEEVLEYDICDQVLPYRDVLKIVGNPAEDLIRDHICYERSSVVARVQPTLVEEVPVRLIAHCGAELIDI